METTATAAAPETSRDLGRPVLPGRAQGGHHPRRRAGAEVEQAAEAHGRPRRGRAAHDRRRHRARLQAGGPRRQAGGGGGEPPARQADGGRVQGHGARRLARRQAGPAPSGRPGPRTAPASSERSRPLRPDRLPLPPPEPAAGGARARPRRGPGAGGAGVPGPRHQAGRGRGDPRPLPPPRGRLVRPGDPPARRRAPGKPGDARAPARRCSPIPRRWRWGSAGSTSTTTTRRARRSSGRCASSGPWRSSSACRSWSTTGTATRRCWRWSGEEAFRDLQADFHSFAGGLAHGPRADRARLLPRASPA